MENFITYLIVGLIISLVVVSGVLGVILLYYLSPYDFYYFNIVLDVTNKRKTSYLDILDKRLCEQRDICVSIEEGYYAWKKELETKVDNIRFPFFHNIRYKQIEDMFNNWTLDNKLVKVEYVREQTRYKQKDNVRTAYTVKVVDTVEFYKLSEINERLKQLADINYETTLSKYHSKQQRNLMTSELRDRIKTRDNYTCQICGKYMSDEVGLEIDHIIPISKGGVSVPSNLQVLCSKCNGTKGAKL